MAAELVLGQRARAILTVSKLSSSQQAAYAQKRASCTLLKQYSGRHVQETVLRASEAESSVSDSVDELCVEVPGGSSHFLAGPLSSCTAPPEGAALLVLLPGALLAPGDYQDLLRSIQEKAAGTVCLWVAAVYPTWQGLDWSLADMQQQGVERMTQAIDVIKMEALRQNFPAAQLRSGRWENLFIISHSSATQFSADFAMRLAGGIILLGSYLFPLVSSWSSLYEWTRPVMHLGGVRDGQVRLSRFALPALQAADCAARFGTRYAATFKPVVLLQGLNHGHMSNGEVRKGAGDLSADISKQEAAEAIASTIVTFLAAHGGLDDDEREGATTCLEEECRRTAQYLSPFTEALGRGSIAQPWEAAAASNGSEPDTFEERVRSSESAGVSLASLSPSGILSYGHGAEMLPDSDSSRRYLAHPAEIALLEVFAVRLQKRIIAGAYLEPRLRQKRVIATVHTDLETFIYSQPHAAADCIVVQAYLHRPNLVPYGHRIPIAPHYFFKLKSGEGLCELFDITPDDRKPAEVVTAAQLHREAFGLALQSVTPEARANFEACGKAWDCAPDRNVTAQITSATQWVKDMHIEVVDNGPCSTRISSPVVIPNNQAGGRESRFGGSIYLKCLSLAGAVEWILCDGLRPSIVEG